MGPLGFNYIIKQIINEAKEEDFQEPKIEAKTRRAKIGKEGYPTKGDTLLLNESWNRKIVRYIVGLTRGGFIHEPYQ